jgi:Skp family chaperone for outer membrane proteins
MSPQVKSAVLTVVLLCLAGLPQDGMAQNAKIAVIDTEAVTVMSDEGKVANEKIEKRVQAMTADMDKMRKDIEAKENDLRTRERLMSATALTQLKNEIADAKIKFERKSQDYQKEIDEMQNTLMTPIAGKIQKELAAFVNEKGFDLLIDLSVQPGNVVWANPGNDITKEMLARVNDTFKKSGGAAAAPAAPAAAKPPAADKKD